MKYLSLTILSIALLFASCTKDRDLTTATTPPPNNTGNHTVIDYWNFEGSSLLTPTISVNNNGSLSPDFTGAGYYDGVAVAPTQSGIADGMALRVRNPSVDLVITAPTTGYKNIIVSYAVDISSAGNAPITDSVYYSTDGGITYVNAGLSPVVYSPQVDPSASTPGPGFALMTFDLSSITAVNNDAGFKFKIVFSNGNTNTSGNTRFDNITVEGDPTSVSVNAPVVSSAATASGTVGTAFSYAVAASNTPTSFALTGATIPGGLSINTTTGVISGTPTAAGTFVDTIKAINAGGTGTKVLTITIASPVVGAPAISSAATASGTVGTAFSYAVIASNTPTSYALTGASIPTGLSINTTTGVISGTPTAAGTFVDTVKATNGTGTGRLTLTITITSVSTLHLLHYWNFNNDNPVATMLIPNTTIGGGALSMDFLTVSGTTGYYDSQASTSGGINAQNSDVDGKSLRVRNPCQDLIISAPTTGYKNVVISYAVEASSAANAALTNTITYSIDGTTFISTGLSNNSYDLTSVIDPLYVQETFDFSNISGANNNANFKVKISFSNGNTNTSGNDRYDNLTVTGYNQ